MSHIDEQRKNSGIPYRLKPPLEHSRIFDVIEDFWIPPAVLSEDVNEMGYPSKLSLCLSSLPPYQSSTMDQFTCGGDFSLFMREIQTQGLAVMAREARALEQHTRKRQSGGYR